VPTVPVVPDLEVLEQRVRQFDAGLPGLPVEQLDLDPRPERLDHGVDAPIAVKRRLEGRRPVDGVVA
jgi:hypothetical protein